MNLQGESAVTKDIDVKTHSSGRIWIMYVESVILSFHENVDTPPRPQLVQVLGNSCCLQKGFQDSAAHPFLGTCFHYLF